MLADEFKFLKGDNVGASSAEDDSEFLNMCYVETGDLAFLENVKDIRVLVLGRTGTGKSALLQMLTERKSDTAISILPEGLALSYVTNSTILNFFAELGVNLDPFFKLLWRHVIIVEMLSRHFRSDDGMRDGWVQRLLRHFAGETRESKAMRKALDYLNEWGKDFWLETECRVKEITETMETKLNQEAAAALGQAGLNLRAAISSGESFTLAQKKELLSRGQKIVSDAQVSDLRSVIEILGDVFENDQKQYFVVIDRLDENWVEERLRYRLIMALIQTASEFIRVRNVKVVLSLRNDLAERVFRLARDSGFQEEKYASRYLPLRWSKEHLIQVLDKRVSTLVARRYTKGPVTYTDILPEKYGSITITEFLGTVTTTPRDVIALFNACIAQAVDQPRISPQALKDALGAYSRSRLNALFDEWSADYACLHKFVRILQQRPSSFKISAICSGDVEDLCISVCANDPASTCQLRTQAMSVVDGLMSAPDFTAFLARVFYRIGLVGLKLAPFEKPSWADEGDRSVSAAEIGPEVSIVVHPKYHRVLGITPLRDDEAA